jgi:hypothetical protein
MPGCNDQDTPTCLCGVVGQLKLWGRGNSSDLLLLLQESDLAIVSLGKTIMDILP